MELGLNDAALAALREDLTKNANIIRVVNGSIIESLSVFIASMGAEKKLPNTGLVSDLLADRIGDFPFTQFTSECLRRHLNANFEYSKEDAPREIVGLPGFESPEKVADFVVGQLRTLFWKYNFSLELPDVLFANELGQLQNFSFGEKWRISPANLLRAGELPLRHPNPNVDWRAKGSGLAALMIGRDEGWRENSRHLDIEVDGFVGINGGTATVDLVQRDLESLFGLALANRVFAYNYQYDHSKFNSDWIVHRRIDELWEFDSRFAVDESISEVLRHIIPFNFQTDYPEDQRLLWLEGRIDVIGKVLDHSEKNYILLASKWFFDSFKQSDEALRFVRLMTSLEILLGEGLNPERLSIGETISNRLAYLIGGSRTERIGIISEFKKIYQTRSSILHRGKHRLRREEQGYLGTLRGYCGRAILSECDALVK